MSTKRGNWFNRIVDGLVDSYKGGLNKQNMNKVRKRDPELGKVLDRMSDQVKRMDDILKKY